MNNEILEEKLQQLNEDRLMLEAIRFVFKERIEKEKPDIEKLNDNQVIGEKYRAYDQAKKLLNEVLVDIDSYKDKKVESDKFDKSK